MSALVDVRLVCLIGVLGRPTGGKMPVFTSDCEGQICVGVWCVCGYMHATHCCAPTGSGGKLYGNCTMLCFVDVSKLYFTFDLVEYGRWFL